MNIRMGGQTFTDVKIPILWGTRAMLEDTKGRISVIDLAGSEAVLEILGSQPAPDISYEVIDDGFKIYRNDVELYSFDPNTGTFTGYDLELPECKIMDSKVQVGGSVFSGNMIMGFGVGIVVTESSIGMGAPLPPGLAKLVI